MEGYNFYPNELDLDTTYRTGHASKYHFRSMTACVFCKHLTTPSFVSFPFCHMITTLPYHPYIPNARAPQRAL